MALLMAFVIPPIGIGLGHFCLGAARRELAEAPSRGARAAATVATGAMVLGGAMTVVWIYATWMLMQASPGPGK